MKRRSLVIVACCAFGLVGILFFWWLAAKPAPKSSTQKLPLKPTPTASPSGASSPEPAASVPATEPKFFHASYPPTTPEEKAMWDYWWNIRKVNPDWEWERPISFYGKVVDQNDQPVAEAKVWMQWSAVGTTPERTMLSGADGRFQISDIKGKGISVRVEKVGYHAGPVSYGTFEYAGFWEPHFHVPDPNNPVIFRLRKRGNEEPMYLWGLAKDLKADGGVNWFNAETGKFGGSSGDLAFIVTRSNQTGMRQFDYTLTVQAAPGGGIAFTNDAMMFEAPADGYEPSWGTTQTFGAPDYNQVQKLRFYLRTAGGKYAAVQGHVAQMGDPEAQVQMTVYFNPSGSRNLEYNEAKRINR